MRISPLIIVVLLLATSPLQGDDWPAWRGPTGDGYCTDAQYPSTWSADTNVKWRIKLPTPGNSTPIVVGSRVFLSGASRDGRCRSLLCFKRGDGKLMWQQHVDYAHDELAHAANLPCSSSPVSDGQRVIVWHGSAGLFAHDIDGTLLWQRDLGKFEHIWGNASSPVIVDDLVILNCGPGLRSFLLAVDKRSGEPKWRREFPGMASQRVDAHVGSWSTPVVATNGDDPSVVVSLPSRLYALDPRSGNEQWWCDGLGKQIYASPVVAGDAVVAMSGHHGPTLAVTTGGHGDVSATHRIWLHEEKTPQRVGSGVIVDDCVYILNEQGIAWCVELASGEVLWKHRLCDTSSWSSMCYADRRIYATDNQGTTHVFEPNDAECVVIARNTIKERMGASLAFSNGQIFLRTHDSLYCIEEPKRERP